jgi:PAS domain S-box-containing protein
MEGQMKDSSRTNQELLEEISSLKQKIRQLEQSESELKKAKESLQENEARVREIVDNAPFGAHLYYLDPDKRLIFMGANLAGDSILKVSNQQFVGKTIEEAFPPLGLTPIPDAYRRVAATGERYDTEQVDYDDGGVRGAFEIHALQIGPNRMVAFFRDITEQKIAEEALAESEAKYRTIVENSLVGVYIIQDGRFRFVNERWCEIFGYPYDEAVDKMSPRDLVHPEDKKIIEEDVRKRWSREADHTESEMKAIRKDGTVITVRVLSSSMLYKGRPGSSGTIIDITEHKRVEEELAQKTALLEAQVNASLDGILIVDKGRKVLQNQQANDLLKIPRHIAESDDDETQIEWVRGLVKNPKEFYEKVSYIFAHPDETTHDELELKDGTVLDRYSGPVVGEDGKRYGRIWTFRDITERKKSEEALRISQNRLSEAMDLANIVYWEVDPADNTYIFNDPFYAFYGTTAEKEGGYRMTREEYLRRFVHPDDLPHISQIVEQRIKASELESLPDLEHRIIRRDGEVRHILARARVIKADLLLPAEGKETLR